MQTIADKLLVMLRQHNGIMKLTVLAKSLGISKKSAEYWSHYLHEHKVVNLKYPTNIFADPIIELLSDIDPVDDTFELPKKRSLLQSYSVDIDSVKAKINIWDVSGNDLPIYDVILPTIGTGTMAMLNSVLLDLSENLPIDTLDGTDPKKVEDQKVFLLSKARAAVVTKFPDIDSPTIDMFSGLIYHQMYGFGEMEIILGDDFLEEIAINSSHHPMLVYHKRLGWLETTHYVNNEEETYNFVSQIGRKAGREINSLHPIMDAYMPTGDRAAATLFPVSSSGNTITIRRFSRNPWNLVQLIDPEVNCMSIEIAALLWLAVQYELNILVAGGTASGKTSALNAICSSIPAKQRILSIEDTRELALPSALRKNWVPLSTKNPNAEGQGGISMLDLMVASLRMRPDRLIVGEVRKKEQAETMFEAMHTGHSVYCTMHADTVAQVQRRLLEPPLNIPKSEIEALHLILVQYRDRRKGMRRMLELAEVLSGNNELEVNYLYRWRPRTDTFEKANESIRLMEELNMHTGMTPDEMKDELKEKEKILKWMLDNGVNDVDSVGKVFGMYYREAAELVRLINLGKKPEEIFGKIGGKK
ncbi:hypothetical protein COV93_07970 [Candidatus Woesearchaeota archaeon CG11_big_fil_rev_8_21_14_0_20_43_8]|nr:MAG: hypothetical protein COV93_07970 [Candidatus Woesearchaeota archaeon CG11_big_fil_rev_8_21_14_0_20_43_8]PIO05532.1 MAG: hypothetical protein COT47_04480 [Candidatus Woesearchaeota archaeon CG08_land_8_20_14_0_20_43_7]